MDGTVLVTTCSEKKLRIYDIETKTEKGVIQEDASLTSMVLSKDGKYAVCNTSDEEIHLWRLADKKLIKRYRGHSQGRFVIRSCFGGTGESLIVSGSEGLLCVLLIFLDSKVYIWHRDKETLIDVLSGHSSTVNSVAWGNGMILASASDDRTIRM